MFLVPKLRLGNTLDAKLQLGHNDGRFVVFFSRTMRRGLWVSVRLPFNTNSKQSFGASAFPSRSLGTRSDNFKRLNCY